MAMVLAASPAVAAPVTASAPPPSTQGSCGDNLEASLNGAYGRWSLSCNGGQITVSGYVQDTLPDGDCAGARGEFASGETETATTCAGVNSRADFTWTHPGSIADVYIYEFAA